MVRHEKPLLRRPSADPTFIVDSDWGASTTESKKQFWSVLKAAFEKQTVLRAKSEFDEGKLTPVWASIDNGLGHVVSAVLYESEEDSEIVFVVLAGTRKNYRRKGLVRRMIEKIQEQNPGKKIALETEKYSDAHKIFYFMGFRENESGEKCRVNIFVEKNAVVLDLDQSRIESHTGPRVSPDGRIAQYISKESNFNLCRIDNYKQTTFPDWQSALCDDHVLEEIKIQQPYIITGTADWFCMTLGDQCFKWLQFRLSLLNMKNKEKVVEQLEGSFVARDLELLDKISNETGIKFVPMTFQEGAFCGSGEGITDEIEYTVPILLFDLNKEPLFLIDFRSIFQERKKLLFGPLEQIKEDDFLAAQLLLPKFIGRRAPWKEPEGSSANFQSKDLDGGKIKKHMEERRNDCEEILDKGAANELIKVRTATGKNINRSLMVLASGIAIQEDGKKCCYTPSPEFNRRLDADRLEKIKGIALDIVSESLQESNVHAISVVPYSPDNSGIEVKDLSSTDEIRLVGVAKTNGLMQTSVQKLFKCFCQANDDSSATVKEAVETDTGMVLMLYILMQEIGDAFGQFEERSAFRDFLCHLLTLVCQVEETGSEAPSWGTLHIYSLGDAVLLSKILWVSLGLPILAPLEGSARLYCANMVLLGHLGFDADNKLANVLDNNAKMPRSLCRPEAPVTLFSPKGRLNERSLTTLFDKAMRLQNAVDLTTKVTLTTFMPMLVHRFKILRDEQKEILTHKNGAKFTAHVNTFQREPLVTLLKQYMDRKDECILRLFQNISMEKVSYIAAHSKGSKAAVPLAYIGEILFGIVHIEFKDKRIKCTSPATALRKFLMQNKAYVGRNASEEKETEIKNFPWVPGTKFSGQVHVFNVLRNFKKGVVTPLVERLVKAMVAPFFESLPEREKKKKNYQNSYYGAKSILTEWLYAYLWELIHWGGINIQTPEHFEQFDILMKILEPVTPKPRQQKENEKKEDFLGDMVNSVKNAYDTEIRLNVFGVVAFVAQHIGNTERAMRVEREDDEDSDKNRLSFVDLLSPSTFECDDDDSFEKNLQKLCPLFSLPNKDEEKISLFELTKWLFSNDDEAKKAANDVNDALKKQIDSNHLNMELLLSYARGETHTRNELLFESLMLDPQRIAVAKGLIALGTTPEQLGGMTGETVNTPISVPLRTSPRKMNISTRLHGKVPVGQEISAELQPGKKLKLQKISAQSLGQYDAFIGALPQKLVDKFVHYVESEDYTPKSQKIRLYEYNDDTEINHQCAQYALSSQNPYILEKSRGLVKAIGEALTDITHVNHGIQFGGVVENFSGRVHQIPHVDCSQLLEAENGSGYICYLSLDKDEGSLLRLDYLAPEEENGGSESDQSNVSIAIERSKFVRIPFGNILIINAKQYHGGLYGSNGTKRFYWVFSNLEEATNQTLGFITQPVGKLVFVPEFQTSMEEIEDFMTCYSRHKTFIAFTETIDQEAQRILYAENEKKREEDRTAMELDSFHDSDVETEDEPSPHAAPTKAGVAPNDKEIDAEDDDEPSSTGSGPHKENDEGKESNAEDDDEPSSTGSGPHKENDKGKESDTSGLLHKANVAQMGKGGDSEESNKERAEVFFQGGRNEDGKYTDLVDGEEQGTITFKPVDLNGIQSFFIDLLPTEYLAPIVKRNEDGHFDSERYKPYTEDGSAPCWDTLNPSGTIHAKMTHLSRAQNKTEPEQVLIEKIAEALTKTCKVNLENKAVGLIWTKDGQFHQASHVDYQDVYSNKEQKVFVGFAPLEEEGSVIRLDTVSKQVQEMCSANDGTTGNDKVTFLGESSEATFDEMRFYHIPFGSMLLMDGKQFHGGNYGSNDARRLYCVIANFDAGDNEPVRHLSFYMQKPRTSFEAITEKIAKFKADSNADRKNYIGKVRGAIEIQKSSNNESKKRLLDETTQRTFETFKKFGIATDKAAMEELVAELQKIYFSGRSTTSVKRRRVTGDSRHERKYTKDNPVRVSKHRYDFFQVPIDKRMEEVNEGLSKFAAAHIQKKSSKQANGGIVYQRDDHIIKFPLWSYNEVNFSYGRDPNEKTRCLNNGEFEKAAFDETQEAWNAMASALIDKGVVVNDPPQFEAALHIGTKASMNELSFFRGHKDKSRVDTITFYLLGGKCWVVLAIPEWVKPSEVENCNSQYCDWRNNIEDPKDSKDLENFQKDFDQAVVKEYGKNVEVALYYFHLRPFSCLRFDAGWVHGTINYGKDTKELLVSSTDKKE